MAETETPQARAHRLVSDLSPDQRQAGLAAWQEQGTPRSRQDVTHADVDLLERILGGLQ